MCIFIEEADVKNTKIFVSPIGVQKQLTIYENYATTSKSNAMVLPVPLGPHGELPQLLDLSKFTYIWKQLDSYFPRVQTGGWGATASFGVSDSYQALPVQRVGGYDCTIVPSLDELQRVNSTVFKLPDNIRELLHTHYPAGFCFLVCLFSGTVNAHAIGYIHAICSDGTLFIPTLHEHNDNTIDNSAPGGFSFSPVAAYEHTGIFCDNCRAENIRGVRYHCTTCPDYDECMRCHSRSTHDNTHIFLEIRRPLTMERNEQLKTHLLAFPTDLYASAGNTFSSQARYDHTIFIVNGALKASFNAYTTLENGTLKQAMVDFSFIKSGETINIQSIQKTRIVGMFPNRDYAAVCL